MGENIEETIIEHLKNQEKLAGVLSSQEPAETKVPIVEGELVAGEEVFDFPEDLAEKKETEIKKATKEYEEKVEKPLKINRAEQKSIAETAQLSETFMSLREKNKIPPGVTNRDKLSFIKKIIISAQRNERVGTDIARLSISLKKSIPEIIGVMAENILTQEDFVTNFNTLLGSVDSPVSSVEELSKDMDARVHLARTSLEKNDPGDAKSFPAKRPAISIRPPANRTRPHVVSAKKPGFLDKIKSIFVK